MFPSYIYDNSVSPLIKNAPINNKVHAQPVHGNIKYQENTFS